MKSVSAVDARCLLLNQLRIVGRGSKVEVACTEISEAGGVKPEEKSQKQGIFSRFVSASIQSLPNRSENNQYFAQPVLPDADPAVYWSSAQKEFPNMAILKKVCAV